MSGSPERLVAKVLAAGWTAEDASSMDLEAGQVCNRLELVLADMRADVGEFFADARCRLSDRQWGLLCAYVEARLRSALEVGAALRHLADDRAGRSHAFAGRGREAFVKAALKAWNDSYAPIADVWKTSMLFPAIPGGEHRFVADVAALEAIAAERYFSCFETELETLFSEGA